MTLETTETPEFPPSACGSTLCVCVGGTRWLVCSFVTGPRCCGQASVGIIALSVGGSVHLAT